MEQFLAEINFSWREFWILFGGMGFIAILMGWFYYYTTRANKRRWEAIDPNKAT